MTCDPADNELVLIDAPVPRAPSWLELHWIAADRSPSSESLAVPVKVTGSPNWYRAPLAGAVMETAGGALTAIETDAVVVFPPPSVTEAVIVCVPADSELTSSAAPVPRGPSWLELH